MPPGQQFLLRSGYKDEFSYLKIASEFYFDGFGSEEDQNLITLSIFRIKRQDDASKNLVSFSDEETFENHDKVFTEIDQENSKEELKEETVKTKPKIYILELKGYCCLTSLEVYSQKFKDFSKKFSPYVQFRSSTL